MNRLGSTFLALMLAAVGGCAGNSAPVAESGAPAKTQAGEDAVAPVKNVVQLAQAMNAAPAREAAPDVRDAPAAVREYFQARVYRFRVPFGAVSRNEALWKGIDEQVVDVATYDLLYKNGIRIGEGRLEDWGDYKKLVDADPACQRLDVSGISAKSVELETKKDLMEETIFHFDGTNQLIGHSYDRCTNLINLSFAPTPRKPGYVRVKLCPAVRATMGRWEYSMTNEVHEITYVKPVQLYDLNVRADIGPDNFLLVTPSPEAERVSSPGHAFFMNDAPAEREEEVLLIVSHAVQTGEGR